MNNKGNRILSVVLVFVMMLTFGVSAVAEEAKILSPVASLNTGSNVVTVSGTHPLGEGMRVTVSVTIDGNVFYKREISAGVGGEFSLTYNMAVGEETEEDVSGTYIVTIGGVGLDSTTTEYRFINEGDGKDVVAAANAANTATQMSNVITTYNNILDLDLSTDGPFGSLSPDGQTAVYTALAAKNNFDTATEIINMFEAVVAIQTLNEATDENAEALVMKYKDILGFNMGLESNFAKLKTTEGKNRLYKAMTGSSLPLDTAKVSTEFERAVYTQLFNEITSRTRDKFMTYVDECNDAEYADFSLADYNSTSLSDTDRADIIIELVDSIRNTPFKNLDAVEKAFEDAASDKAQEVKNSSDDSSRRPSGGGGGTIVIGNVKNDEQTPQTTPDGSTTNAAFNDLSDTVWAVEAINYLAGKGIVNGVGNGQFNPNGYVKREEFVKIMMLSLQIPSEETEKRFNDVEEGQWYYRYIQDAYALNLVAGVEFDVFGVGQNISREQMCTMLYRAMKFMDINIDDNQKEMNFSDNGEISDYAYEAVEALYRAGIVNGTSETEFNPKGTATRAMAVQMIYNLMKRGNM